MRFRIVLFFLPLLLQAVQPDAYIWQRQHTPAVRNAAANFMQKSGGRLYFLAGELENDGKTVSIPPLAAEQLPLRRITPVIRIHIRHLRYPVSVTAGKIIQLYRPWQKYRSLQIDLDAPERRLDYYTELMKELRNKLPQTELSATVLPCHLRHREEFSRLAGVCDYFVLQIHGLEKRSGKWSVMDRRIALKSIADAINLRRPFKIALPLYCHHTTVGTIKPDLLLVKNIAALARRHNIGTIAFRLGISGDGEALALPTLLAVCSGREYTPRIKHFWEKTAENAWHLHIVNDGYFAEKITLELNWNSGFTISDADTFNGAKLDFSRRKLTLTLPPDGENKPFLWLRTPAPFDKKNSPLTITTKDALLQ